MKIKILSDVFNICKRVKHINSHYVILYNNSKKVFELYNEVNNMFLLTLPFNELDCRSLNYIRQRNKKTNEEILKEINIENEIVSKKINEKIILNAIESAEKVLKRS